MILLRFSNIEENPFESHFRNVKSEKSTEKRQSLVNEYKNRGKAGGIKDRRFGGKDEVSITTRYAIERNRNTRKKKFDLDSDDEQIDNFKLTHNGRNIDEDDGPTSKNKHDDDDEFLDDKIVEKMHFGGKDIDSDSGDDFLKVKKTKEEVFKEIVAKSKLYKAMRAEVKDENEELIDKLDEDFADIVPFLNTKAKLNKDPAARAAQAANMSLLEVSQKQKDKLIAKKSEARKRDQKFVRKADMNTDYNYDHLAFSLKDSARARPQLLVKSEKEKAIDRKEELERLEKDNKKSQNKPEQLDDESENDDDAEEKEEKKDLIQMNHDLVDIVDGEGDESEEEEDEFEAIDEDDSD